MKNEKGIFFSVIISSDKSDLWERLWNSLLIKNKIPFEIIFVGPRPPVVKLPEFCTFIQTTVKPAQCWEIASRKAVGEYLLFSPDDVTFSKGFLNKAYDRIIEKNNDKLVYTSIFRKKGRKKLKGEQLISKNYAFPKISFICFYNTKIWRELGGIDSRFVSLKGDVDMQLRFFENGGKLCFIKDCLVTEHDPHNIASLSKMVRDDKATLHSFWIKGPKFSDKRLKDVLPFDDKDILNLSQGPKKIGKKEWV